MKRNLLQRNQYLNLIVEDKSMVEDREIRIRLRVDLGSQELKLADYLNSKDTLYPPKDMVMIALTAYWLPLAEKYKSGIMDEDLIKSSIYRLRLHQEYLEGLIKNKNVKESEIVNTNSLEQESEIANSVSSEKDDGPWLNPFG